MLLATIPPPPLDGVDIGGFTIHLYGICIALGAMAAITLLRHRYKALGGDPDIADRTAIAAAIFAFAGARLGFVLPRLGRYLEEPLQILAVREGGLTFFGALVGGLVGLIWYTRRRHIHLPSFLHAGAPAIPLAQAIGRWGNYFNQELYGLPTDLPWALRVEAQHRMPGFESFATFHPTFLYEMLWNLGLMAVLLVVDRRTRLRRGALFLLYLAGYGVGRFWVELLRIDTPTRILGLSRNGWNALAIILVGTIGFVLWQRREADSDPGPPDESGSTSEPEAAPASGTEETALVGQDGERAPADVPHDEASSDGLT